METSHSNTRPRGIPRVRCLAMLLGMVGLSACGAADSGGTTIASDTPASGDAAAAVAQLFGKSASSASLSKLKITKVEQGTPGTYDTCVEVLSGQINNEHPINTPAYGAAATYGSQNSNGQYALAVTADDFCTQADGTVNTGTGADGKGLVAAFLLTGDVNGSCTGGTTIVMQAGSLGVWRNRLDTDTGVSYQPEIWGNFHFLVDGVATQLDCTLKLGAGETIIFADCSDGSSAVVSQDTSASCQIAD